jgi:hypothetical protein
MYFDITISLTPYRKDGVVIQPSIYPIKHVFITNIPIMAKSVLCNLYGKSAVELRNVYQDDPTDPGGYIVAKSHEYIFATTESVLYNYLHLRKMGKKNDLIKGMIISRGD